LQKSWNKSNHLLNRSCNAYTFIEVIVGIVVMVMGMGVLGALMFTGRISIGSVEKHLEVLSATRYSYDAVVQLAKRIKPPFWIDSSSIAQKTGENLEILYVDGNASKKLLINTTGNTSIVTIEDEVSFNFDSSLMHIELATQDEVLIGLSIEILWSGTRYKVTELFGGFTL